MYYPNPPTQTNQKPNGGFESAGGLVIAGSYSSCLLLRLHMNGSGHHMDASFSSCPRHHGHHHGKSNGSASGRNNYLFGRPRVRYCLYFLVIYILICVGQSLGTYAVEDLYLDLFSFLLTLLTGGPRGISISIEESEEPLTVLEPAPFVPANTLNPQDSLAYTQTPTQINQPSKVAPSRTISSTAMSEQTGSQGNEGLRSVVYYVNWVCHPLHLHIIPP